MEEPVSVRHNAVHKPLSGNDLLQEALRQPGVREVIAFYEQVRRIQAEAGPYLTNLWNLPVNSTTSDSST